MKNGQCMFVSLLVQTVPLALSFQVVAQAQDTATSEPSAGPVPAHTLPEERAGERAWHEGVPIRKLEVGETVNVSTLSGKIYFSGQPAEADLKTFAEFGVKTVINLRTQQEIEGLDFDEAALVKEAGMKYVNFPMGRELPAGDSLEAIFSAIDRAPGETILIHCASSNRVGAIWGAYSKMRLGLSVDDAVARGKAAGMRAPAFEAGIRSLERSH